MQKKLLKEQEHQVKKTEFQEKRKMKRGILASLRDAVDEARFRVEKGVEHGVTKVQDRFQEWDYDFTVRYFTEHFPTLRGETVWDSALYCRTISNGVPAFGVVIVTTNHVCFDGYQSKNERLQFIVPLKMVVSLAPAATIPSANPKMAPLFQVVDARSVADAVLLFTSDSRVHSFYSFMREKSLKDFLNIIDHAWRAVLTGQPSVLYLNPGARPTDVYPNPPQAQQLQATFSLPATSVIDPTKISPAPPTVYSIAPPANQSFANPTPSVM